MDVGRRPRGRPRKTDNDDSHTTNTREEPRVTTNSREEPRVTTNSREEPRLATNTREEPPVATIATNSREEPHPATNNREESPPPQSTIKPSTSKKEPQRNRNLRARKERKLYSDEWASGDDDIDGGNINVFSIQDKVHAPNFSQNFVKEMDGSDFNLAYIQRHGFNTPVLFKEKTGLGIQVPDATFTVNDVRTCVGSRRILDVMDVATQKNSDMTMKEWQKYYESPQKDKLLNVISLEFSHTRLEHYVRRPNIVRQIDWVDCVWPRHLKEAQRESTNSLENMMYPKVQKYCLMSVKGCYTDFHIDLGGTSVWYHILKGAKVFWLIPPTEQNIHLYEQWVLSGKQSDIFFGDTVEKCDRVMLTEGNTFFIPTGWIHAVFTLKDSLVFGGNFLHSFGIEKQLQCAQVEEATKVLSKYRYPFFTEMLWYVLERYVYCLLGKSNLREQNGINENRENVKPPVEHVHLTPHELRGLKAIIKYVYTLPSNKKNVPDLITDPILLIKDVRTLIELHGHDNPELSVTGRPVIPPQTDKRKPVHHISSQEKDEPKIKLSRNNKANLNGPRRRRTRCKNCQACKRADCGECAFCHDMVKFGGPGKAKQTCVARQCLQPMLPVTAACKICGLDGWGQPIVVPITKLNKSTPSSLMECSVCYEIVHPACANKLIPDIEGPINEELPNSWECPKCCKAGKNIEYKPRHFRARQKSSDLRRGSEDTDYSDNESNDVKPPPSVAPPVLSPSGSTTKKRKIDGESVAPFIKSEPSSPPSTQQQNEEPPIKRPPEEPTTISSTPPPPLAPVVTPTPPPSPAPEPRKLALRTHIASQLTGTSSKALKRPMYPIRPAAASTKSGSAADNGTLPPHMSRTTLLHVFKYFSPMELTKCGLVCKAWMNVSVDPSLWKRMDVSNRRLTGVCLAGILRRQPECLIMDWTAIVKRQLEWLIQRLTQLRELSLQGCAWNGVAALRSCNCPMLTSLDISFVTGMNDSALRDILSPPKDTRPGLIDTKSRLRNLKTLKLSGCEISDVSLRYIVQNLPQLSTLDLSQCFRLTDAGIAQLTATPATTITTMTWLDLSGCTAISDASLDHLSKCQALKYLDLRRTTLITTTAINKFVSNKKGLQIIDDKLLVKEG